jgi:hypothetical protein
MKTSVIAFAAAALAVAFIPVGAANAATRHHHVHHRIYDRAPYGGGGWSGADPTAGPNSLLRYYRRNGDCAIDEGYGRATLCD